MKHVLTNYTGGGYNGKGFVGSDEQRRTEHEKEDGDSVRAGHAACALLDGKRHGKSGI